MQSIPLVSVTRTFVPFQPGCWQALPAEVRRTLIEQGRQALETPLPAITAAGWLAFTQTGERAAFEEKYFTRRRAVCARALAACCEPQGPFLPALLDAVWLILEESAWQLPAHNTYVRDTAPLPLPDVTRPVLDLFACETGALLATVLHMHGDALEALAPGVTARIGAELRSRILQPYLDGWFWWMGGRGQRTLNWTVWCTQNLLLTALLAPFTADERQKTADKAVQSLNAFLADYGEDGCCDEGAQYYRHAGLCLYAALDMLDVVSGGGLAEVWQAEKIQNIAAYILHVHVHGEWYVNFADCSPLAGRCGAREYLFARRCGLGDMARFAANDYAASGYKHLPQEINLYYRALNAVHHAELLAHADGRPVPHPDIYYPSTGLMVARDEHFCLAVKAGNNNDNHNHNDVGSVTLYHNGQPLLIDIGVETYTAKTFSPQRYDIWAMQSSWHNLPEFGGVMQAAGAQYAARDVVVRLGEGECTMEMELAPAWPKAAGLQSYTRRATLHKGGSVMLEDAATGSFDTAVLNLIFCTQPVLKKGCVHLQGTTISFDGAGDFALEEIQVTDARLRLAWPEKLYRLRVSFAQALRTTIGGIP